MSTSVSVAPKDNGAVTALSVVGLVFGLLGMFASFVPCLGMYGLYVSVPAAIASGAGLLVAKNSNGKKSLAVAALTISLIGMSIAGYQKVVLDQTNQQLRDNLRRNPLEGLGQ